MKLTDYEPTNRAKKLVSQYNEHRNSGFTIKSIISRLHLMQELFLICHRFLVKLCYRDWLLSNLVLKKQFYEIFIWVY